jgi:predicted dehydrogenase
VEPIALFDQNPERLGLVQRRFPRTIACKDQQDLFDRVQGVVVATSASFHYEITRAAVLAGKDVLVEKPFVLDREEGKILLQMAENTGCILMVGHVFLYNPGIQQLKTQLNSQTDGIGKLYYLYATRTNLGPIRKDVDVVWDLAPHDISIFNYLLQSDPLRVSAVAQRFLGNAHVDVAFITLAYRSDILAHIHVGWADPNRVRQVVVVGSQKRIVFDDIDVRERLKIFEKGVSVSETETDNFGQFLLAVQDGAIISPRIEPLEPLTEMCADFLACMNSRARPLVDGKHGLSIVNTLTSISRSIEMGGTSVQVDPVDGVIA